MADVSSVVFPVDRLRDFIIAAFCFVEVPQADAELAAEVLLMADLRGIDSHGIARLHSYVEMTEAGMINPRANIRVVRESPSTATVDGDNGLGLVVGPKANEIAMEKAEQVGSGWASVCNSNHFGIAGYYPLQALKRDMIGMAMTNSTSLVAPTWGIERQLGTNPLATAFPGHEEPPVVIDLATSAAAFGKIEIALRTGQSIPEGWVMDKEGKATTDPARLIDGGVLLPLGSDRQRGGHKGYCLSAMVDILSCMLSGANFGPFAPPFSLQYTTPDRKEGKGLGHFFGAWRIDAFVDPDQFKRHVDEWVRVFRATKPEPGTGGPLIPGDPEREAEQVRRRDGIPLVMPVVEDLRVVAKKIGVLLD